MLTRRLSAAAFSSRYFCVATVPSPTARYHVVAQE